MLAEKMDEKSIIKAAWSSDEQQFKQAYIKSLGLDLETGEKSYNGFQNIMRKLKVTRKIKYFNYIKNQKLHDF